MNRRNAMAIWAAILAGILAVVSHELFPTWVKAIIPAPYDSLFILFSVSVGAKLTHVAFGYNWDGSDARTPAPPKAKKKKGPRRV